jgi:cell division protein FtsL
MEPLEYAISKDIRNTQIVRELDRTRQRELFQYAGVGMIIVGLLLYSAWQHFELVRHGYRLEEMQKAKKDEEAINRSLKLQLEVLKSPQRIERLATERLRMIEAGPQTAIVIERATPAEPPAKSILARR